MLEYGLDQVSMKCVDQQVLTWCTFTYMAIQLHYNAPSSSTALMSLTIRHDKGVQLYLHDLELVLSESMLRRLLLDTRINRVLRLLNLVESLWNIVVLED